MPRGRGPKNPVHALPAQYFFRCKREALTIISAPLQHSVVYIASLFWMPGVRVASRSLYRYFQSYSIETGKMESENENRSYIIDAVLPHAPRM